MENNEAQSPVTFVDAEAAKGRDEATEEPHPTEAPTSQAAAPSQTPNGTDHLETSAVREALKRKDATDGGTDVHEPSVEHKTSAAAAPSASTQNYVPPAKKYSAVNINKAFLKQQQTSVSGTPAISSAASNSRQTSAIAKPTPQAASTHSRLVTAKLTVTPSSSSPGPGWSRPNSVTPPVPSPSNGGNNPKSSTPISGASSAHGPPQMAPGGKIIHPQARGAGKMKMDGQGKPVWRNVHSSVTSENKLPGDFPTAAEAAQGRLPKSIETKPASDATEAQRQALSETADAFRGVHLDPNAHHWDDMEEDDSDFLSGVIEFGDGRQYNIQPNAPVAGTDSERPVSKEERFADDVDRAWPRARAGRGTEIRIVHSDEQAEHIPSSAADSGSSVSGATRDSSQSRVLYNERSNRMEPLPEGRSGTGVVQAPQIDASIRRNKDPERSGMLSGHQEDAPSHTIPTQVLQKGEQSFTHRSDARALGHHGGAYDGVDSRGAPSAVSRFEHDKRRQDHARPPTSRESSISRDTVSSTHNGHLRQQPTGRAGPWGKPSTSDQKDIQKQAPPQMTTARAFQDPPQDETAPGPEQTRQLRSDQPSASPDSHDTNEVPSFEDVEALRKAFLAQKVEQAKKRIQQEEEERAKAAERARQKADQLARLQDEKALGPEHTKADDAKPPVDMQTMPSLQATTVNIKKHSEDEANNVTDDATGPSTPTPSAGASKSPSTRLSELKDTGVSRAPLANLKAQSERFSNSERAYPEKTKSHSQTATSALQDGANKPPASVLPSIHVFDLHADDATEVVDFFCISKLAGGSGSSANVASTISAPKVSRPYGPGLTDTLPSKADSESWRRPTMSADKERAATTRENGQELHRQGAPSEAPGARLLSQALATSSSSIGVGVVPQKVSSSGGDMGSGLGHTHIHPMYTRFARSPGAPYKEVPLSALDDTMSRIKGALDGLHVTSASSAVRSDANALRSQAAVGLPEVESISVSSPKPDRWLPPALRAQSIEQKCPEIFTRMALLHSPSLSNNTVIIRLPRTSHRVESLSSRQLKYLKHSTNLGWEILSFIPRVEGMSKTSLSVNDVLFLKPQGPSRAKRFPVALPTPSRPIAHRDNLVAPIDCVPTGSGVEGDEFSSFGRSKIDQDNWHVTASSPNEVTSTMLAITSRSPPPDFSTVPGRSSIPVVSTQDKSVTVSKVKSHKLPEGDDVAFYRDTRRTQEGVYNIPIVTFTVSSELEDQQRSPHALHVSETLQTTSASPTSNLDIGNVPLTELPLHTTSENSQDTLAVEVLSALPTNQPNEKADAEVRSVDKGDSYMEQPSAQLQQTPVWAKAAVRVPDPEHLKAVWSQASEKEGLPTINSLKSIADDLTAVPFMLHEVKSEDGGTPPPPPGPVAPPTRMSASEVTKAFQTVPSAPSSSLSSSTLRSGQMQNGIGSPVSPHKHMKPSPMGLPVTPSMSPPGPRPQYLSYPSVGSHSPSPPTLMYSHMPNGLPGSQTTLSPYGQPVWAPIGSQVVRQQPPSPYSPSMVPYHAPGTPNGMYAPSGSMGSSQASPNSYASARSPQMVVSPALAHATPVPPHIMYPPASCPVIISPVPPPGNAQPRQYGRMAGVGRGSIPAAHSPMDSRHHAGSVPPPNMASRFPSHGPGYSHVPHQPFIRPW